MIGGNDRRILRDLAKRQLELASSPQMQKLREDWKLHGEFSHSGRPMILIETASFKQDILPSLLRCEGLEARALEEELHLNVVNHTLFGDDTIVRDYLPVSPHCFFVPFDIDIKREHADGGAGLGHQFVPVVKDLHEDFHRLGKSRFGIDRESTQLGCDYKSDILGDILPARLVGSCLYTCPTMSIVHIMHMEDMFTAMYDYPDLFHRMMRMLTEDYLEYFDFLEAERALLPTFDECHLGQGSYCFNNELPRKTDGLKTTDLWGYIDSQESSGVSPEMFIEFIAPYYRRMTERYGLLSYGCCEAVDPIWDCFLSKLGNLRKLSISSWCNEEFMGERLQGRKIVYMRKPSPNLLGVGANLDEDAVNAHIERTVKAAGGCNLEIVQRDVYKISNTPDKVRRYVELIRNCCEMHKY